MQPEEKLTSIILCGGKATRFGGSKATATVGGRTVLDRVIAVLEPISREIIAVAAVKTTDIPPGQGIRVVADIFPGAGPLGGIYTGLCHATSDFALVVGCDMPFLNVRFIHYMIGLAGGYDAVVPRLGGRYVEPLHAIYAKKCIMKIQRYVESGRFSVWQAIRELNVRYVDKEEFLPLDPRMLSFFNINTPEDLARANRIAAQLMQTP